MTDTPDLNHATSQQVRLLGGALGDLMEALGRPLRSATGPELLMAAEELTTAIREGSFERDAEQQAIGGKRALREFAAHVRETAATEDEAGYATDAEDRADVLPARPLDAGRRARAAEGG